MPEMLWKEIRLTHEFLVDQGQGLKQSAAADYEMEAVVEDDDGDFVDAAVALGLSVLEVGEWEVLRELPQS